MNTPDALAARALRLLDAAAVDADAAPMEAYMKGIQPFRGVKKPARAQIVRALAKTFAPSDANGYRERVLTLWNGEFREQRYLALELGRRWKKWLGPEALRWLLQLVREGAWWDLVDELAQNFVGQVWLEHRDQVSPLADAWIDDDDLWVRRVAVIGQNRHKAATDAKRLFRYCRERAHEKEFFMRKAIGWALREYSKSDGRAVRAFLEAEKENLSGLSLREGGRLLEPKPDGYKRSL